MEEVPRLSLKWNHFKENFTSQFEYLKEEEEFVDVTFSCQGKLQRAHKIVLSASSPYLTALFKENPCKHPVIILDDMPFAHLESLLAFIYTGAVSVAETELPALLESANLLQIRGLSDQIPTPFANHPSPPQLESNPRKRGTPSSEADDFPVVPKRIAGRTDLTRRHSKSAVSEPEVKKEDSVEWKIESESMVKNEEMVCENGAESLPVPQEGAICTEPSVSSVTSASCARVPDVRSEWEATALQEAEYPTVDGRRRHSLDPRPCPICNRLYSNLSNLRQHLRLIHNPTVVKCKLCSKSFKTDLYLRRHLISFHGMNLSPDTDTGGEGNRKLQPPSCFKELLSAIQMNPVRQ